MPHKEILDKILESITNDIDKIVAHQKITDGELDTKSSIKLLEYGKYLRTDKSSTEDDADYSKLSLDEINAEILKAAQEHASKGKK